MLRTVESFLAEQPAVQAALWVTRELRSRPRLMLLLQGALVLYTFMALNTLPAEAAPNPLEALDRKDGTGFLISDYEVEYLTEWNAFGEGLTGWIVSKVWTFYANGIGASALVIDLTLGFVWLEYLTYPIEQTAAVLDDVLDQFPAARSMLITAAVALGLVRMFFGQQARGLTDMLASMTAWGISAAIVTNPVAWITGPNGILTRTKEASQQFSAQLVNPSAEFGEVEQSEAAGSLAQQVVTVFVRKPHQFINYGGLADGGGCEGHYNKYLPGTGTELAEQMASCSPDFAENIEHPSGEIFVAVFVIVLGAAVVLAIAILMSVWILLEAANMLVQSLMAVWELFRAIGPGGSWRGLLAIIIGICGSAVAILLVILFNSLYLAIILHFFDDYAENLITLFVMIDLVLIVIVILAIRFRKKLNRQLEQMKERAKARKKPASGPVKLSSFARRGVGVGAAAVAGSKLAPAAGRAARTAGSAVKRTGSAITSPVRGVSRRLTRPGFAQARLGSGMLNRAGIRSPLAHRGIRGLAYGLGERKWHKKEARREKKRAVRDERRARGRFWTWGGATRDAQTRVGSAPAGASGSAPSKKRNERRGPSRMTAAARGLRRHYRGAQEAGREAAEAAPRRGRPARHRSRTGGPAAAPRGRGATAPRSSASGSARQAESSRPARVRVPGRTESPSVASEKLRTKLRSARSSQPNARPPRARTQARQKVGSRS